MKFPGSGPASEVSGNEQSKYPELVLTLVGPDMGPLVTFLYYLIYSTVLTLTWFFCTSLKISCKVLKVFKVPKIS